MALTEGAHALQIAEGLRCNLGNINWVEIQCRHSAFQGITCIRTEAQVIFENENLRVISATWKAGQADQPHSHPVPSVIYSLNDCTLKITNPDGTTRDLVNKAGSAMAIPITASHTARNVGSTDCQAVFVERK